MDYNCFDMGSYNLHLITTKRFKTITVEVNFRRPVVKNEISKRVLLKDLLLNSTNRYPVERDLIIASENLFDLKLIASSARMGNYTNLSFKVRFLNEKFSENGMNKKSIDFLMDVLFNPNIDNNGFNDDIVNKCKKKIVKSIKSLKDNKIKYAIFTLLESIKDKPYSYNSYGYIDDLDNIDGKVIYEYYKDVLNNDLVDIFVVGDFNIDEIKDIFRNSVKVKTFHKNKKDIIVDELDVLKKEKYFENLDNVNQSQLTMLCSMNSLTDFERKYVSRIYNEILGGSSSSILFDTVREKNSYAYYINSEQKSYDNILIIYSGIEPGNSNEVVKLIKKSLSDIEKGKIDNDLIANAKKTLVNAVLVSMDSPNGIINSYYAKVLVNSDDIDTKIKKINEVTKDDVIRFANKVKLHTIYLLEGEKNEEN